MSNRTCICGNRECRATLDAKDRNALSDSDFAYIDSKGGRHLPCMDEAHVRAALGRFGQTQFESAAKKATAARKIVAAAKKFGIAVSDDADVSKAARSARYRSRRDMPRQTEHRRFDTVMELRDAGTEGHEAVLHGVAIVYGREYGVRDMYGSFDETMHPGVAANCLGSDEFDCKFLYDHKGMVMARSLSGTLEFEDRSDGLHVYPHIDLRQPSAMDLYVATERGDVTQMSAGFLVADDGDEWRTGADGREKRDVHSLRSLEDVSAVAYPASTTTSIGVARSALGALDNESRERVRRMWYIAKEIRSGREIRQADGEALLRGLEALYEADEASDPDEDFEPTEGRTEAKDDTEERTRQRQALLVSRARLLTV